jgi:alkylhydroperoxidase family enzyme
MRRLTGRESGPMAIWAHAPRAVPAVMLLNGVLETGAWALEPDLRKLVHLRVAQIVGCVY